MSPLPKRLVSKVQKIMEDPRKAPAFSAGWFLSGLSTVYGALVQFRVKGYEAGLFKVRRLPCLVISIGNITAGGTGKTPMTLHVAELLQRLGYQVAILSRGYRGGSEKKGGIVSDKSRVLMTPAEAGDEAHMMASLLSGVPVLVGRNRAAMGRIALARFAPDILLLDDGFQHLKLYRDMDLVLVDAEKPLGSSYLLPRGSLREPSSALARADAILFTRCRENSIATPFPAWCAGKEIFHVAQTSYVAGSLSPSAPPEESDLSILKGARVFAFSGIAHNKDFHDSLKGLGSVLVGTAEFPDHHAYSATDLAVLRREAQETSAQYIATTQKDLPKLPRGISWPCPLLVLGVRPRFLEGDEKLTTFLKEQIEKRRSTPLSAVAFLDGRPGHEKQTRGIVRALSRLTDIRVDYRPLPTRSAGGIFRQWLQFLAALPFSRKKDPPVDLILGTGSQAHLPMLLLKRQTKAKAVTCMNPLPLLQRGMDLCFVPAHDRIRLASNILETLGPPNLSEPGGRHKADQGLILVGGKDEKSHVWDSGKTLAQIRALLEASPHMRWRISSSPRTPEDTVAQLSALPATFPQVRFFPCEETPPGWIETAYAESAIVWVTADSISMVYEALTAGCRVGILPVAWKKPDNKFQYGIDALAAKGYIAVFAGGAPPTPPLPPHLDEASRCALEILVRWWPQRLPPLAKTA